MVKRWTASSFQARPFTVTLDRYRGVPDTFDKFPTALKALVVIAKSLFGLICRSSPGQLRLSQWPPSGLHRPLLWLLRESAEPGAECGKSRQDPSSSVATRWNIVSFLSNVQKRLCSSRRAGEIKGTSIRSTRAVRRSTGASAAVQTLHYRLKWLICPCEMPAALP